MLPVRTATPRDLAAIGEVLARAFHTDPVSLWLMPDEDARRRRSPAMFRASARNGLEKGGVWTTDPVRGAALWCAPGRWKDRPREVVRQLPALAALGRNVPRALRTFRLLERHHPTEEHWYLDIIGTDPDHQGTGVGSALLRPVLARCDDEVLPAYLVSSNVANIPFYERHGFRLMDEITVPGGPVMYPMWRDPRPTP
ncbi:MAG: GNAT family N-acetyltransferase [Acidimicrobiia bacterium]|nr:GNAT family N-acetyltransferase [Acidimicrobiia bacterium]